MVREEECWWLSLSSRSLDEWAGTGGCGWCEYSAFWYGWGGWEGYG